MSKAGRPSLLVLRHVAVVVFFVVVTLAAACRPPAPAAKEESARSVDLETVKTGDAVRTVALVGTLEGASEVQVFAPIPERIVSLRVKEGDVVKRGAVLAQLASDVQTSQVEQAEAGLFAAEANRDALRDDVERTRKLVAAGAATSSQLESLEAQLRAIEAQVRQTATGLGAASIQRRRSVITAPISGKVANLVVKEGDTASPAMPLMRIVQGKSVKGVFQAPEREFLQIRAGMPVELIPLGDQEARATASVTLKGPVVDRRTRTGLVEVHVDNDAGRLLPGSAVRGVVELERRSGVVLVPALAVLLTARTDLDGRAVAFVAEGERARRRDVVIGARQRGDIEVQSGLAAGEKLIVRGQHLLRDGNLIEVGERRPPGEGAKPVAGDGA